MVREARVRMKMGQKPAGEQSQEIRKAWKRKRAKVKGMPGTHGEIPGKRGHCTGKLNKLRCDVAPGCIDRWALWLC